MEGLESFSIQDLWRSAGISQSSDPKEFVSNVGKEALKPRTWIEGYAKAGQIVIPVFLTTIMTGGLGDRAVFSAETNSLRLSTTTTTTTSAGEASLATNVTTESSAAPNFIVDSKGTVYPVPEGANPAVPADNGKGIKFDGGKGGANGQVTTMRIMDPTPAKGKSPGYPDGYVTYSNAQGQGVNPYTGKTVPRTEAHFPINGSVPTQAADATYVKKPVVLPPTLKNN